MDGQFGTDLLPDLFRSLGVLWEVWDGVWALKQVLCLFKQCIIDVGLTIGCSESEKCFRLKLRYEIRGVVDVRATDPMVVFTYDTI